MTFRLLIPGRDIPQESSAAISAIPLITVPLPISGLAELATVAVVLNTRASNPISGLAELAATTRSGEVMKTGNPLPINSFNQSKYSQSLVMLPPEIAAAVERERLVQRQARIVWMGYVEQAGRLVEILSARDRRIDDRRLCVECANAGPGWHCRKKQGFLTDVLQRCAYFEEST